MNGDSMIEGCVNAAVKGTRRVARAVLQWEYDSEAEINAIAYSLRIIALFVFSLVWLWFTVGFGIAFLFGDGTEVVMLDGTTISPRAVSGGLFFLTMLITVPGIQAWYHFMGGTPGYDSD